MLPSHRRGQLGLLNVQVPGGYSWQPRLHRQIGLQGGDKCQPKAIKVTRPLFWLSDPVPPPSTAQLSPSRENQPRVGTPGPEPGPQPQNPDPGSRGQIFCLEQEPQNRAESSEQRPQNIPLPGPEALQR